MSLPLKSLFLEMMRPPVLHHFLSWTLSRQDYAIFESMSNIRYTLLSPVFFHENLSSTGSLKSYWQNQIYLLKDPLPSSALHPDLRTLYTHLKTQPQKKNICLSILEGFIYEMDTQWSLISLSSQRSRIAHHLGRLGELCLPTQPSQQHLDFSWCQKIIFYQYRGLFHSLFSCEPQAFIALRNEIYDHTPQKFSSLSHKIFIRYHQFLLDMMHDEDPCAHQSYSRPSVWGIMRFLWSVAF